MKILAKSNHLAGADPKFGPRPPLNFHKLVIRPKVSSSVPPLSHGGCPHSAQPLLLFEAR